MKQGRNVMKIKLPEHLAQVTPVYVPEAEGSCQTS